MSNRSSRALDNCVTIDDLHRLAKRRLPAPMFEYLRGGAEDERALRNNFEATRGFNRYRTICETSVVSIARQGVSSISAIQVSFAGDILNRDAS
jgi:hypothetical protein